MQKAFVLRLQQRYTVDYLNAKGYCEQVESQVFVHSTRLLSMYTAPRGRPAL